MFFYNDMMVKGGRRRELKNGVGRLAMWRRVGVSVWEFL